MTLSSLLKLFEKILFGGLLLGFLLVFGAWQWEARTARSILDNTVRALQQEQIPEQYRLAFKNLKPEQIPDSRYRIVYQDQHFFWGRWYCVSFIDDTDLIIEIFPYLLQKHEINIKQATSCRKNS